LHKNLNKFNDAINQLDEALRIFKKLSIKDSNCKKLVDVYVKERVKFVTEKKEYEK